MKGFWGRTDPALLDRARELHPERYSPTGEPLIEYPGSSWAERLAAWHSRTLPAQASANVTAPSAAPAPTPTSTAAPDRAPEYDDEPAIPDALAEPPIPEADLDAPYGRIREGGAA